MKPTSHILQGLSQIFFPHICPGCASDLINSSQLLCLRCISDLPLTDFSSHRCNPIEKIFRGRVAIVNATSILYFTKGSGLQHLLHQLKYNGRKEIGVFFGEMMGNLLIDSGLYADVDALVPLPLFSAREKKRGYNQAKVICNGISAVMQIPCVDDIIIRKSSTETQTHKNRIERWQNIEGKFALIDPLRLKNMHVLLVDDIITTGATLESCAAELIANGIKVSIATLAYTLST